MTLLSLADGSAGRVKANHPDNPPLDLAYDIPAVEWNNIAAAVVAHDLALGEPDGSTAGSIFEALLPVLGNGTVASSLDLKSGLGRNPTSYSTHGLLDTASYFYNIEGPFYMSPPDHVAPDVVPSIRWINGTVAFALVPNGYPTSTQTINGAPVGEIVPIADGLHLLYHDGAGNYRTIACANSNASVLISGHAASSVVGRAGSSSGDAADIVANTNDRVLARVANALTFTTITEDMISGDAISTSKIQAEAVTAEKLGPTSVANWLAGYGSTIPFNNQRLSDVSDPSIAQDVATKNYVDGLLGGTTGLWSFHFADATLNPARRFFAFLPDLAGGPLSMTLPSLPVGADVEREFMFSINASAFAVTLVRAGGLGTINSVSASKVIAAVGVVTLYRAIMTENGTNVFVVGPAA